MKHKARIWLDDAEGQPVRQHSPLLCHIKVTPESVLGYSVKLYFDDTFAWVPGSERLCDIEFIHWEGWPDDWKGETFWVWTLQAIGKGEFIQEE